MNQKTTFHVNSAIDVAENASYSLVNNQLKNVATVVIRDLKSTIYFEDGQPEAHFDDFGNVVDYAKSQGLTFVKLMSGDNRWKEYNPNPGKKNIGDCTLRSYCAAFNITWEEAFDIASEIAKKNSSMIQYVADKVLKEHFGCKVSETYNKKTVKSKDRITVNEFAMTHPYGTYILHVRSHQVTVKDGEYWDSWDSGKKKIDVVYELD